MNPSPNIKKMIGDDIDTIMYNNTEYHDIKAKNAQFSRESDLNIEDWYPPDAAIIIGLGGIGSNVADILSTIKEVNSLVLFDSDMVEVHNLNRSAFVYEDINTFKVEAMMKNLMAKNPSLNIYPIRKQFNKESASSVNEYLKCIMPDSVRYNKRRIKLSIFDCRDDDYNDYSILTKLIDSERFDVSIWRLAYNGTSMTIDNNPEKHRVLGQRGYETVPSHGITSKLVSLLGVSMACSGTIIPDNYNAIPLTFDIRDLLQYLHVGIYLDKTSQSKLDGLYSETLSFFDE